MSTVLEVKNISKRFGGTQALNNVSISFQDYSAHAIVGENGAGKSTLMSIISGIHKPDSGQVIINGVKVDINNPSDAKNLHIGFVHQEISLCQHLNVVENIFMNQINKNNSLVINYKKYAMKARIFLAMFNSDINPYSKISELTISQQQIIEIIKTLSDDCRIIIFDEPTASLSEKEANNLLEIISSLKDKGISIIYISHRMAEIFKICDKITVLRDGNFVETVNTKDTDEVSIVNKMVGRDLTNIYPEKQKHKSDNILLEVVNLSSNNIFKNINFQLYEGEILGMFGLIGSGRSEIVKSIVGLNKVDSGNIIYLGNKVYFKNYSESIKNGILYLTEDRKTEGLFLEMDYLNNICAMDIDKISVNKIVNNKKLKELGTYYADKLNIKVGNLYNKILNLSGGNQQKVLISKLLSVNPKIIIMDEPTRGIDVGAKHEIHYLLRELVNKGIGIIVISSELPEIIGLSDRVMVIHQGNNVGTVANDGITEENLIQMASFGKI